MDRAGTLYAASYLDSMGALGLTNIQPDQLLLAMIVSAQRLSSQEKMGLAAAVTGQLKDDAQKAGIALAIMTGLVVAPTAIVGLSQAAKTYAASLACLNEAAVAIAEAAAGEAMGAGTLLVGGAAASKAGTLEDALEQTAKKLGLVDDAFSHGFQYADRVRVRGIQDPVSHNFPYTFDDRILATNPIPKPNGYNIYQMDGTMNGKTGVFEIGVTKDGIIDHRFF